MEKVLTTADVPSSAVKFSPSIRRNRSQGRGLSTAGNGSGGRPCNPNPNVTTD